MQSRAVRKYIRSAPKKMRAVANAVRGKNVAEAISALGYMPHRASEPIARTLRDAVFNLIDQHRDERIDDEGLYLREIRVDQGPKYKRFRPAARGRAHPYRKHTSHLTVVIATEDEREDEALQEA